MLDPNWDCQKRGLLGLGAAIELDPGQRVYTISRTPPFINTETEIDMGAGQTELTGPDLTKGIALSELSDGGTLVGHADGEAVLVVQRADEIFAIGATCTHYSGPLHEGLVVGDTVRCPWHHACFSLRTGEALRAPALNPVDCWTVEQRDDKIFVVGKQARKTDTSVADSGDESVSNIVIVGAGAAGDAAAEMLRRRGFAGSITMIGADSDAPYDRPNLSKDYLAGNAPEEWLPLRSPSFYEDRDIDLILDTRVTSIDTGESRVETAEGSSYPFDHLLLATGADPVKLPIAGADRPQVYYLRTLADCRAIIDHDDAKTAVVIGAGFIGMEVAASLRAREIDVHIVAPESKPLERVLGSDLGGLLQSLHEGHGATFHLERTVEEIGQDSVTLSDGSTLPADIVIIGVGVRPSTSLAEKAGLKVDNGIVVDQYLETSQKGIFAAGDAVRWPNPLSDGRIRVEHWVVAQRLGQVAAQNMLGFNQAFDSAPFFWTQHYELPVAYVGHAGEWDRIDVAGSIEDHDCLVAFRKNGDTLAVVGIYRDQELLEAEAALERGDEAALKRLIPSSE